MLHWCCLDDLLMCQHLTAAQQLELAGGSPKLQAEARARARLNHQPRLWPGRTSLQYSGFPIPEDPTVQFLGLVAILEVLLSFNI